VTAGTPFNSTFVFQPDGTLVPTNELSRFSTGVIGGAIGGNGQTGREDELVSILPFQNRYNTNLAIYGVRGRNFYAGFKARF